MRPLHISRKLFTAGCLYLLITNSAIAAGPPIPYDGYTVSNGAISAACPLGATCDAITADNGFLQRRVTVSSGPNAGSYFQFILTDPGVTGDPSADAFTTARGNVSFTNEDFVKIGNRGSGISSKQSMFSSDFLSPTIEDRFSYQTMYEFGWAQSTAFPWVNIQQDVITLDYGPNPLVPQEVFSDVAEITSNADGFNTNIDVDLSQRVDMGLTDVQKFQYKVVAGIYQTTAHPPVGPSPLLPGGTNGGEITWTTGEKLAALWIGQSLVDDGGGLYGLTKYENLDQATKTQLASFTDPEPVNWINPPFDAADTISAVDTYTPTDAVPAPNPLTATVPAGSPAVGPTTPVTLPVAYDSWSVSNGSFTTTPCGIGVDCSTPTINSGGLLQRLVTVGGDQYIQTIVTDTNATGNPTLADFAVNSLGFKSESFVKMGQNGVASNLHIAEQNLAYKTTPTSSPLPSTGGQFVYNALLKNGWANGGPLDPTMVVDQRNTVLDNNYQNTASMDSKFHMELGATPSDKIIDISAATGTFAVADIIIGPPVNINIPGSGFYAPIMFRSNIVQGAFQNNTHALSDPDLLPSISGDIAWASADAIQATWVGGAYATPDPSGPSIIGLTSYTNLSTGDRTYNASLVNPNPESWAAPFGAPTPAWVSLYVP